MQILAWFLLGKANGSAEQYCMSGHIFWNIYSEILKKAKVELRLTCGINSHKMEMREICDKDLASEIISFTRGVVCTDHLINNIFLHSYLKTNQALDFCITALTVRGIWGVCHPGII